MQHSQDAYVRNLYQIHQSSQASPYSRLGLIDHSLYPRLGLLDLYYFRKPPADLQVCLIVANSGSEEVPNIIPWFNELHLSLDTV
jgi:hypothetical protein